MFFDLRFTFTIHRIAGEEVSCPVLFPKLNGESFYLFIYQRHIGKEKSDSLLWNGCGQVSLLPIRFQYF